MLLHLLLDQEVNAATALPTLPTLNTDIYWWKTLLTGDEINNYLTGPATEAATGAASTAAEATPTPTPAAASDNAENASATATVSDASITDSVDSLATSLAGVESSLASAVSEVSASASDAIVSAVSNAISTTSGGMCIYSRSFFIVYLFIYIYCYLNLLTYLTFLSIFPLKFIIAVYSTPSAAWSSAASYASPIVGASSSNGILPRPSGSIIPPVTTSGSALPSNSGALVIADLGKILFSVCPRVTL